MKNWTTYVIASIVLGGIIFLLIKGEKIETTNTLESTVVQGDTVDPQNTATPSVNSATPQNSVIVKNGMKIETTKEGTGPEITNGQTAVVDYVGKLEDGAIFDESKKHGKDFEFQVGAGMVIKGWDQGVLGMKVGETRILTIPSDLAYGSNGIPGVIPGAATLIFEVTLHGIK